MIKGQGRTLACRILGIERIPAIVVSDEFADTEKVQQFLVENVARLRMRPIDRALLIAHARKAGEETTEVARRFGVTPSTVRRLQVQMEGATSGEVAALRASNVNLALHAAIARHVKAEERAAAIAAVDGLGLRSSEMHALFVAVGWRELTLLGDASRVDRIRLLRWACETLAALPRTDARDRLRQLAMRLPADLEGTVVQEVSV